jgi:hypothetical protein
MLLFASDEEYHEHDLHVVFMADMVEHYCFLFADNVLDDHEVSFFTFFVCIFRCCVVVDWNVAWPFFYKFLHHTSMQLAPVPILELGSESQGFNGAMALAAAVVGRPPDCMCFMFRTWQIEHMLNLIANCKINIRVSKVGLIRNPLPMT